MSFTGTWQIASYSNPETMTDPVGFFLYPPVEGKPIAPPFETAFHGTRVQGGSTLNVRCAARGAQKNQYFFQKQI